MKTSSLTVCTALLIGLSSFHAAQAQIAPAVAKPPATEKAKADAQKMQQLVSRILQDTSKLRQLKIKRQVPSGVISRTAIEKMLNSMDKEPSNEVVASQLFLIQTGLAPANFDLKKTYIGMMGEQIAGFYDLRTKKFFTNENVDSLQLETVMAHELTHALQDQNFDLSKMRKWPAHDSDAELAMLSLMEGDATYTMSRYMTINPFRALGMVASVLKPQKASPIFQESPRILRDSVVFPYTKGLLFATELYKTGGWAEISKAYTKRPLSTEQILHYDKYLDYEPPVEVKFRDLTGVLGKNWKFLDHDVNGEAGSFLTICDFLKDDERSERAAAGWGGDRLSVYRDSKGAVLIVQDTVWDTPEDAREWREAYALRSTNRFKVKSVKRDGLEVWNGSPNGVWMEQRGKRVLILEGKIGSFNPTQLFSVLWR